MNFHPLQLDEELSTRIESAFYFSEYTPDHEMERLIPDGLISLVIELDGRERFIYDNSNFEVIQTCTGSWLSGMHNHFISISALPDTELAAIRFKPGGFFPFFGSSVYEIYNRVNPAISYFPDILDLRSSIMKQRSVENKLGLIQKWLLRYYKYSNSVNSVIEIACRDILENPTLSTLEMIKNNIGYSEKQFIHLFKKQVGITPKMFQRIIRFNQILPLIQEKESIDWAKISEDCGYYDQSHFIRDFKRFSGFNPVEFLESSSGRTNFIPMK